ncbi:MAG: type I DNA topoisomerase [Candidatus Limnocylindrales bacterium]
MTKNLVIVESPAKARTIERYLGPGYKVLSSYGHVRDLPENPGKNKLGVDVEHDFAPEYVISEDRKKQVAAIAKEARGAETVYLATDLDREGEAIAWHVAEAASVAPDKARRVTFSEITADAIRDAFEHPRDIDHNLVDAQQARRILDRLVGYTLSPLLWRKVRSGLSAGRVQSVAVRLVVDREREINAFTAREYWTIEVTLETDTGEMFTAEVAKIDGETLKKGEETGLQIGDAATAEQHAAALRELRPLVDSVSQRQSRRNPAPPFTTSTLQQEASRKLSFNPKRTMRIAQDLYEGLDTKDGRVGLITYMRTDSTTIASIAEREAKEVVATRYGLRYMYRGPVREKKKSKGAQEAHEAIRPTSFARDPDSLASELEPDQLKLYRLIWQRALASQMAAKELETTTVDLKAARYDLRASATRTIFDGFSAVYTEGSDDSAEEQERTLPALAQGDITSVREVTPSQHFTQPPPRYTEASLIKALEERGIGRPSTYAATISTIIDRGYVSVAERRLRPEDVGEVVTDLLVEHFGEFVDYDFTARMEDDLDEVANGTRQWVPLLRAFYGPFAELVGQKSNDLKRSDFTTEESDEVCSEGHPMVIRLGRNGRFLACSLYPEHKETRPLPGEEAEAPVVEGVGEKCPQCGEGELVARRGRFGAFAGCSRYPDCNYIRKTGPPPPEPLAFDVTCPKCNEGQLVARRARRTGSVFWGCSRYPKCDFTSSREPVGALHDADDGPVAREGAAGICLRCGAPVDLPEQVIPGIRLPGGDPNPEALVTRRGRGSRTPGAGRGGGRAGGTRTTRTTRTSSATNGRRRARPAA